MNTIQPTVFIVDDDHAVRDALMLMIEQEGITVRAFESGQAFLDAYQTPGHGCLILDIRMPLMDGMQVQQALLERNIALPIIFLTGHGDIPLSVKAIKAGAADFLTKPITREQLIAAVSYALELSVRLLSQQSQGMNAQSKLAALTEREREVMGLAVLGYHNKEIARALGISHRTVEIHKSKIMHKTGAANLLDLARIANEGKLHTSI